MEGQTLSHYKVLEKLGGGGMGVVYKALDTHLDRHVALKLLPPELTRDDDARERFVLEAKAASALDHPNICTIHDIDETPDGQMFIAMGYYDGETLKKRIERGLLPVAEALDIAMQVAQGLTKAHESGIVHRDIKPANVIVTADGLVKIVDFGIAKLLGVTGPTQTGTTLGTVSYMSPEQVSGQNADERSDVWSLGAVLYEMLTGERPFQGDNQWAVMNAIRAVDPKAPSSLRPEVSESVEGLVNRALEKVPDKRIPSASDFVAAARIPFAQATKPPRVPEDTSGFRTRRMVLAAVLAGAAVVAVGVWVSRSDGDSGLTSQRQIDEVQGLISDDSYFAAFEAAELLDASTAGGPAMSDLWPQISAVGSLITDPPGAEVFYRAYSNPNAQWRRLGEAPLEGIRLPRGFLSLRIERNGFVSRQLAALNPDPLGNFLRETPVPVALAEGGTIPERMVSVPSRSVREIAQGMITGNDPVAPIPLGEFLIDQYEVTNREFKQFVDGGGYGNPDLWADEFRLDGLVLTRDEAMADLVDATGRPGPSTWELGTYPTGEDDHPVTGVSWYEAAAYARFVGKSLPTIYHWATASGRRYSSFIVAQSNFGGEGPVPVGQLPSLGPFGTYDMAGNVREWCLNTSREDRWILGGAWNDPSYLFTYANVQSPFDRSAVNGFRLVEYEGAGPPSADAARDIELSRRDYYSEAPVSDEVFAVYQDQFLYDPADLEAVIDEVVEDAGGWTRETVSFNAAYDGERVSAHLYLPAGLTPPYQTVIVFPGSSAIFAPSSRVAGLPFYDFLVRSGRAVLFPVYKGTFERNDGLDSTWPNGSVRYADYLVKWVQDLSRSIDYLETRDDIDAEQLAYFGLSWGGRMGAIVPAVEPRLKTAVLYLAGLAAGNSRPEVDQLNYVTRVTIPVLMLNGEHDAIEPLETSQLPMYELLGTPDADKRHRSYDSDHSIPRNAGIRETLDWLDKYLGPIN